MLHRISGSSTYKALQERIAGKNVMAFIIAAIITLFAVITIISVSIHTSSTTKPGIKFRRKVVPIFYRVGGNIF